ncbi:MAG: hypothetical protein WC537_02450 [Candidatus Paceibacterota bacterium]
MRPGIIKNWAKIIFIAFLVVFALAFVDFKALAASSTDAVTQRKENDKETNKSEADITKQLQKDDLESCEEEADSIEGGGGADPSADPFNGENPLSPFSSSTDNEVQSDDQGNVPSACSSDAKTAKYIVSNEGVQYRPYADSNGQSTGIGHFITGNEPFDVSGQITDAQVKTLFDADFATAQNCAPKMAAKHGVNWGDLSDARKTVITDMSYNLGCGNEKEPDPKKEKGIDGFNKMWANIRDAQSSGSQTSWDKAGREIMLSDYANDVGDRAENNEKIMSGNDSSVITTKINQSNYAKNFCSGSAFRPEQLNLFAWLFGSLIAQAQDYVPVQEQDGDVMDYTEKIEEHTDKTEDHTDKIRTLSIQICTHLKAIHRIQQRFETKEFNSETATRRTRASELRSWQNAMIGDEGLMQKGGKDANGNSAPLYVTNLTDYQAETAQEAEDKILVDIANSDNAFKDQILRDISDQEAYGFPFNTTITTEDLNKISPTGGATTTAQAPLSRSFALADLPIIGHLAKPISKLASLFGATPTWAADPAPTANQVSSEDKWAVFLKLMEPRNNRYGSYLQAISQLEQSKAIANENAANTYLAGQGFLPTRECEQWVAKAGSNGNAGTGEDMVCAKWKTNVPASINKEGFTSAVNLSRDMYVADPQMGATGPGEGPDVQENATGKPKIAGGGAPGPAKVTSVADVPSVAEDTGEGADVNIPPGQNDNNNDDNNDDNNNADGENSQEWGNLNDLLDLIMGGGGDSGSQSILQWLIQWLASQFSNQKPLVTFKSKAVSGQTNQFLLYWVSPNATDCTAGNNWLSQIETATTTASTTPKKTGDSLGKSDKLTIAFPSVATTSTSVIYKINCQNANGSKIKETTIEKQQ